MKYLFLIFLLFSVLFVYSTHLKTGEITIEHKSSLDGSHTYEISFTALRNPRSSIPVGQGVLSFGDGTSVEADFNVEITVLSAHLELNIFTFEHSYAAPGTYIVSYLEENRTDGIINMTSSENSNFYLETELRIDPFLGINNSPKFLVPAFSTGATGQSFTYSPGAIDADGDSLVFKLGIPKHSQELSVMGYKFPNHPDYYENLELSENPSFYLDLSGNLFWDSPGTYGKYTVIILVEEWRKVEGEWYRMGFVTRDMIIEILPTTNYRPNLTVDSPCLVVNDKKTVTYTINDIDEDAAYVSYQGELFSAYTESLTSGQYEFEYEASENEVSAEPYFGYFSVTDYTVDIEDQDYRSLTNYVLGNILVHSEEPKEVSITQINDNEARIAWANYADAAKMQIWYRPGSFEYPDCEFPIQDLTGYELMDEVEVGNLQYTISLNNLPNQSSACFRLIAKFEGNHSGTSAPSEEVCILVDNGTPVITAISTNDDHINLTWQDFSNGESYEIFRKDGDDSDYEKIAEVQVMKYNDFDINPVLSFSYRVVAMDNAGNELASSVSSSNSLLSTNLIGRKMELSWDSEVAWSNHSTTNPFHYVYRSTNDSDMLLYDSVNVFEQGFRYSDFDIKKDSSYCYQVNTIGAYGNGDIISSFTNSSCAKSFVTSSKNVLKGQFSVFPNPFENDISFNQFLVNATLIILDTNGKILFSVHSFSGNNIVLPTLNRGIYILQIRDAERNYLRRIIKK